VSLVHYEYRIVMLAYGTSGVLPMCPLVPGVMEKGHMRFFSTNEKSTYDVYCVGEAQ
jgi:hypothetical protein